MVGKIQKIYRSRGSTPKAMLLCLDDVSNAQQAETLMQSRPLDGTSFQTKPILILIPSSNFIAATVLASLHGLMGCFPTALRISTEADTLPFVYHAAEVLNLQAIRDKARRYR